MANHVSIIGAGIGGLTLALVLKKKGIAARIYESASAIKPVGAGIILANNAMQVFRQLGIHHKIEQAGNRISYMKITDAQLRNISVVDLTEYEKKYGVHNIAIHRGDLQNILAQEVGMDAIQLSKKLTKIEKSAPFKLLFEDNSTAESKIVIGADGIKSVVRNQFFEKSIMRNAHQTCWRGISTIDLPKNYHRALHEAWGRGKRFGFVKISEDKVYWYALANAQKGDSGSIPLADLFGAFHSDILNIIHQTDQSQIMVSEIMNLQPINTWHSQNICLIGDAAHATTPNLGQGACQAIEDAYVLGKLLDLGKAFEDTFQEFEAIRRPKAHYIVHSSWALGKVAHWSNPLLIWLRNKALRLTPNSINQKQLDKIFEIN